ncbi:DNA topoisomerase [Thraustotheca clavata]|uniref:DNA topoisomerase n=1 Tax=Thraustotheca clavata TaxID=74557 RepID=A0A1V9Y6X7_9STRA|nr:DNA topoisomerase [Thraustotheca clavata]
MRVLNVAEKPSVAKEIAAILSNGSSQRRPGFSQYNGIFEFPFEMNNQRVQMVVTSVTGHLMALDFASNYRSWKSCDPVELFSAAVEKTVREDSTQKQIEKTLKSEASKAQLLVLWLDCDREGENIAFEVKSVCEKVNRRLRVLRARFSALIPRDIHHAIHNLVQPNENLALACDARSEIDLRLGAAFTRFQTMRIQKKFPAVQNTSESRVVSFGSCQFPTLGFVVDRYLAIESFVREPFYYLHVTHTLQDVGSIVFTWSRTRVYDHLACLALYETCLDAQIATITSISRRDTSKRKPFPLTTVEFQKRAARWLRISSEQAMTAAEALYNRGLLSYPRTETDSFKEGTDLMALLALHTEHETWGGYVSLLQNGKYEHPRSGKNDDQAHPPIHPTKSVSLSSISNDVERKVYEFVVLHFLACCSMDARGSQTNVTMQIAQETFSASGLMIRERNYLDIYRYEKWAATVIPVYERGDQFVPTIMELKFGETSPPPLLTESDLIAKMDQHGIGTDATIAEHINTILKRQYAIKMNNNTQFKPTELGLALVKSYDRMGYQLAQPDLRAAMERDCNAIAQGQKTCNQVVQSCMEQMRRIFESVVEKSRVLDETFQSYFGSAKPEVLTANSRVVNPHFGMCGKCNKAMELRKLSDGGGLLTCAQCKGQYRLPIHATAVQTSTHCPICRFIVVEIQKSDNSPGYMVCPFCFNEPPNPRLNEMACYNCTADCPFATGTHDNFIVQYCLQCASNCMKLRKTKTAKYVVSCTDFPNCKESIWLPAAIAYASVTANPCPTCSTPTQTINRAKLRFQNNLLPPDLQVRVLDYGANFETCVFCDNIVQSLAQGSIQLKPVVPSQAARSMNSSDLQSSYQRVAQALPSNTDYAASITGEKKRKTTKRQQAKNNATDSSISARPALQMEYNGQQSTGNAPTCKHQQPCVSRVVSKNGENKGREFWACSLPQAESCGFFEWKDNTSSSTRPKSNVMCLCGEPAIELTSKSAQNPGRTFYKCAKSDKNEQCKFFEWADSS